MTIIENVGRVVRRWSDVSHKVYAAGIGGGSSALVLTVLSQVFPHWHPGTLTVGAITAAVSVASAYWKGDKVDLSVTAGSEVTTITLPELPEEIRNQIEGNDNE